MITELYEKLMKENVVMTMESLQLATGRPRESILRDLKNIGYFSSYNARGKFYTLCDTPEFDECGLWKYRSAYFSSRRTVLNTAEYLVSVSIAGYTHGELRRILGIGIQNSLCQLAVAGKVARRRVGPQYVYFGKENFGEQEENRNALPVEPIARKTAKALGRRGYPDMDPLRVVDILIAILRGHATEPEAHGYLCRMGSAATAQEVAEVFHFYDIAKKNSSGQI